MPNVKCRGRLPRTTLRPGQTRPFYTAVHYQFSAGTYRPPIAPPATFPGQFVEDFACNFPRNPAEATVQGTVEQLAKRSRGSISSSAATIETNLGSSTHRESSLLQRAATKQ